MAPRTLAGDEANPLAEAYARLHNNCLDGAGEALRIPVNEASNSVSKSIGD